MDGVLLRKPEELLEESLWLPTKTSPKDRSLVCHKSRLNRPTCWLISVHTSWGILIVYYRSWALQTMKGILLVTHDWMSNRCNSCCLGWWWHYSNLAFSERWAKRFQYVLGPVFSCLACAWDVRSDAPSTLHIPARAGLSYSWASNSSRFEGREWVGLHLVGCFSWITFCWFLTSLSSTIMTEMSDKQQLSVVLFGL